MTSELTTDLGKCIGNVRENCTEYLGIKYAKAERFKYAIPIDEWDETVDATHFGDACEQYRHYFQDLTIPERKFYHREFREGLEFSYSEDCLNLNIYVPNGKGKFPVLVFIHGGGFNSMANSEGYLDGEEYAKRGIMLVCINYRVGVFGYLTHEEIEKEFGHDGNFGVHDQLTALQWIKKHISSFGGDSENITVMGQSAGAISLQYLCLMEETKNLFSRAIMLSGAGAFPKFALPKDYRVTREYWKAVIESSGAADFAGFRNLSSREVLEAVEKVKKIRKDTALATMPVIDGKFFKSPITELIKKPNPIPYMVGITNNDMYTIVLANMAVKYTKANRAYLYLMDADAPGDNNQAFHSSDLRYVFGSLDRSWRPYGEKDRELSALIMDYIAEFVRKGDPNGDNRPKWERGKRAMTFNREKTEMKRLPMMKLLKNTFSGDPK